MPNNEDIKDLRQIYTAVAMHALVSRRRNPDADSLVNVVVGLPAEIAGPNQEPYFAAEIARKAVIIADATIAAMEAKPL